MKLLQAGAIPFRSVGERWEFLLVTSQRGNWIFPKGIVEPGQQPEETAAKECREEGGVQGEVLPGALGSYKVFKWLRECQVLIYLLRYEEDTEPWEESNIRRRGWYSYEEAGARLKKPELKQLLESAHRRLESEGPWT